MANLLNLVVNLANLLNLVVNLANLVVNLAILVVKQAKTSIYRVPYRVSRVPYVYRATNTGILPVLPRFRPVLSIIFTNFADFLPKWAKNPWLPVPEPCFSGYTHLHDATFLAF